MERNDITVLLKQCGLESEDVGINRGDDGAALVPTVLRIYSQWIVTLPLTSDSASPVGPVTKS